MNGNFSATDAVSTIVEASGNRGSVTIQHYSGGNLWLGFGELPAAGKGVRLSSSLPIISINDHRAGLAVLAVCDAGQTATGGFVTA